MRQANPVVIPRNHHVAAAITDAEAQDYEYLQAAFERWKAPFEWQDDDRLWALHPRQLNALLGHFAGHNAHCLLSMFMAQRCAGLYNQPSQIRRVG